MAPPPLPEDQRDTEQLRLLAIFHYVAAGLGVLGLLGLLFHFLFMRSLFGLMEDLPMAVEAMPEVVIEQQVEIEPPGPIEPLDSAPLVDREKQGQDAARNAEAVSKAFSKFSDSLGWIKYLYLGLGAFAIFKITLNILSARFIGQRRNKIFSLVTGGLNCMSFPIGTMLGVFTFVVLSRESVSASYRKNPGS